MRKVGLLTLVLLLCACSDVAPPKVPPTDVMFFPAVATDGFATYTTSRDFPVSKAQAKPWIADGNKIVAAMEGTDKIAKPVDIVVLLGEWPAPGAVRRVELADGHFTLERVLTNTADEFSYQIWGLTSAAGRNIDHIHGVQSWTDLPDGGSRLTWSYKVKPDAGFKKPFVQRFVNSNVQPFLDTSLDKVVAQAEREFAK